MRCDIIMPVYNKAAVLPYTLKALAEAMIPPGWEVGVVAIDDGSTDGSLDLIEHQKWPSSFAQVHILSGRRGGPGSARNKGIISSRADVLLLLGADIILRGDALSNHLLFHEQHPDVMDAVLGGIRWDPRLPPTPLMEWMMHGGPQNDFDSLLGFKQADPAHSFYASNLSLKRVLLAESQFNATLGTYGWEDLELGRRLKAKGMRLHVLQDAIGLHRHSYSAADIIRRQRQVGAAANMYSLTVADQNLWPPARWRRLKVLVYRWSGIGMAARAALRLLGHVYALPRLFLFTTAGEFWRGWYSKAHE